MEDRLAAAVGRLTGEEAFRLVYQAYEYLRDLPGDLKSSTRALLHRIRANDVAAVLTCIRKMLEEQDEVWLASTGRHVHEGLSHREMLVNELQQSIFWPLLLAVGRGIEYDSIKVPAFLDGKWNRREPENAEFDEGQRDEVTILRRALTNAGRRLSDYNKTVCEGLAEQEIALADLRRMAKRDFMMPFLEARL